MYSPPLKVTSMGASAEKEAKKELMLCWYCMRVDVTCPLGIFLNKIFAKANISNFRFEKTSLQHVYHY